jgi:hypothetical protein
MPRKLCGFFCAQIAVLFNFVRAISFGKFFFIVHYFFSCLLACLFVFLNGAVINQKNEKGATQIQ